jgi:formylglycine-generating enzyme required for sulfatase activity
MCFNILYSFLNKISLISSEPKMIVIPSGSFLIASKSDEPDELQELMGSENKKIPYDQRIRESPQSCIFLMAYELGRYPITNREYAMFVNEACYEPPSHWKGKEPPRELLAHPVVNVSWVDAVTYCEWLSKLSRKVYRLPTENEWKKAARGITGYRYPWGNKWDALLCNNIETGPITTTPVGQFSPGGDSVFGCADMIGNVWEWCSSRYGYSIDIPVLKYPYDVNDGSEKMEVADTRILRGGSFLNGRGYARCEYRGHRIMTHRDEHTGFRCAKAVIRQPVISYFPTQGTP